MSQLDTLPIDKKSSVFLTLCFVAFLVSGQFRPLIAVFSGSLALFALIGPLLLCFLAFLYHLTFSKVSFSKWQLVTAGILFVISALLIFSSSYTYSESHYLEKLGQWCILLFAFWFPQVVKLNTKAFIYGFILATFCIFSVFLLSVKFAEFLVFLDKEMLKQLSTLYLTTGTYLGLCFILVFFLKRNLWLLLFLFALLLYTGARGPLLFLILCYAIWVFFSGKIVVKAKQVFFMSVFFIITLVAGIQMELPFLERFIGRFSLLLEESGGTSVLARLIFLEQVFVGIEQAPILGHGVGSFGFLTTGVDYKKYPHNLLLEVWYDAGVLALFSFVVLFLFLNYASLKNRDWALFVLVNYFLLNSLKSSSYVDHRVMMATIGFLLVIQGRKKYFEQSNS